jgi:hypothetical protein
MDKHRLTVQDLEAHLDEQLAFLEASACSFDNGFEGEAKRLATTMRVLLHDTRQSHSLVGQLGKKNARFADTALPLNPANLLTHGGLITIAMGAPSKYVPMLDDVPVSKHATFEDWWNMPVFVDKDRNQLTREQLVLIAANQDGGAHVDPALDRVYADLARNNSLNWMTVEAGQARPMDGPERAALRQIAHEVLKTFKPGYAKSPKHRAQMLVAGPTLQVGRAPQAFTPPSPQRFGRKTGRNERCPCGSGKKYKHCHGKFG